MPVTSIQQQNGAALVVGLMILLLATFLAVASMNNANMQERMAANSQNENIAFQSSESAIDDQIRRIMDGDISRISAAKIEEGKVNPAWPTTTYDAGEEDVSTGVEIRSMGDVVLAVGSSLDGSEENTNIGAVRFEIRAASTKSNSGARANIVQGIEYR